MKGDPELVTESVDRRSGKRLQAEMRIYHGPEQKALLTGFSVNLSSGGLYLGTDFPLELDEKLILSFTLPGQERSISCEVRVAWVNPKDKPKKPDLPPGAGLQFINISLESAQAIRRFMKHNDIEPTW